MDIADKTRASVGRMRALCASLRRLGCACGRIAPAFPLLVVGSLTTLSILVLSSQIQAQTPAPIQAPAQAQVKTDVPVKTARHGGSPAAAPEGRAAQLTPEIAQVAPSPASTAPASNPPNPNPQPGAARGRAARPEAAPPAPRPAPSETVSPSAPQAPAQADPAEAELDTALDQLQQSQNNVERAGQVERMTLIACAIFLAVFALIAIAVLLLVSRQARRWHRRSREAIQRAEEIAGQLAPFKEAQEEIRSALPKLLQEVGDQPLSFQEEGMSFPPKALTVLEDIDHLAYLGDARLSFRDLSPASAAVYLNGLLLSAVARLARSDPWTAVSRLNQFFEWTARYPGAVDHHRIAQAYSYRAQAVYQALEAEDEAPSWLRKSERSQTEGASKQAFADVAQAARLDPEWKHAIFVEAQLCSRHYLPDEPAEGSSRAELFVRGLRRAVSLYKDLIDEKAYRGPARHNLARCLKRIAEQTGEKSDFSEFGYALSSFPTDEELSEEGLAARRPASQDCFLWQWMLADAELFRSVERLNLAEYRSFWLRLLDNKVHLRNWRADLGELLHRKPEMRDWSVQLLHAEPPISLADAISRRPERFDTPSSGT